MSETPAEAATCPCICHMGPSPRRVLHTRACCPDWNGDLDGPAGESLPHIVERIAQLLDAASLVTLFAAEDAACLDRPRLTCRAQAFETAAEIAREAFPKGDDRDA